MAVTAKPLFSALQIAAADTVQYTAPGATKTIIDKFTGTNTTGVAATLTVFLTVAAAGAASNTIVSAKSIAPGECYTFPELVGHVLNAGDQIRTSSGTANAITARASGREIT
jgi:hypothetical protein